MIVTLFITIVVEGSIVIGYSLRRKKPLGPLLFTSILANLLTQSLLWAALTIFYRDYLVTLTVAEILIWIVESVLLYFIPANRLQLREAVLLSLSMNLTSLAVGWLLPG